MGKQSGKFTLFIENTRIILECFAIIAAGVWALIHFDLLEIDATKSNFNGSVSLKLNRWHAKRASCIFDFEITANNIGKRTQKLDHIKYTVCTLAPPKAEMIGYTGAHEITGVCSEPPVEVKMNPDFIIGQTGEVHPGEKKMTVYSFEAPARDWPWQVEATGYADKDEKNILFKGSDWQFCSKPEK